MQSYKHFMLVFGIFFLCHIFGNSDSSKISRSERNKTEISEEESILYDVLL
jgi:hypothetical protein